MPLLENSRRISACCPKSGARAPRRDRCGSRATAADAHLRAACPDHPIAQPWIASRRAHSATAGSRSRARDAAPCVAPIARLWTRTDCDVAVDEVGREHARIHVAVLHALPLRSQRRPSRRLDAPIMCTQTRWQGGGWWQGCGAATRRCLACRSGCAAIRTSASTPQVTGQRSARAASTYSRGDAIADAWREFRRGRKCQTTG